MYQTSLIIWWSVDMKNVAEACSWGPSEWSRTEIEAWKSSKWNKVVGDPCRTSKPNDIVDEPWKPLE